MEGASTKKRRHRSCITCGFRHLVIFLTFMGIVISIVTKASFSVALVAMVNSSYSSTENSFTNISCSELGSWTLENRSIISAKNSGMDSNSSASKIGETFDWDLRTQSSLLAAQFYGSIATPLIGGILTHHLGTRWVFGVTVMLCSALYLITPLAARWNAAAVITIRVCQGILLGSMYAVRSQVVSQWMPVTERSRAFVFLCIGSKVGFILGLVISGFLAESKVLGGWPSVFYAFGISGIIWFVFWITLVSDSPQHNNCILQRKVKPVPEEHQNSKRKVNAVPWKDILKSLPVWSYNLTVIGKITSNSLMYLLPMYTYNVLHYDIKSSSILSSVPLILEGLVEYAGGYIADVLQRNENYSTTIIRKSLTVLGFLVAALCSLAVGFSGCRTVLIVVMLCVSLGMIGLLSSGCLLVPVDMSPTFSAVPTGMGYALGSLAAGLLPYVVNLFTSTGQTQENWSFVFITIAVLYIVIGLQFMMFGSAERQPWDTPKLADNGGPAVKTTEQKPETTKF